MAGTAELADRLDVARRSLEYLGGEVGSIEPWVEGDSGTHSLRFALRPADLDANGPIPGESIWYAHVSGDYPAGIIDIVPAAEGGITETFAHQLPNDDIGKPWRSGKVCLVDVVPGRTLAAAGEEPHAASDRLRWHVSRTIGWLRRASHGLLLAPGEPFELPVFGQFKAQSPLIAFLENAASFEAWQSSEETVGLARLARVHQGDRSTYAVASWRTLANKELALVPWGTAIREAPVLETAIWIRFPALPVRQPWRAPQTWGELREIATGAGFEFDDRLTRAASAIRDGKSHFVLIGFPIERIMGDPPTQMHWTGFRLPAVSNAKAAKTPVPGFRTGVAARLYDRRYGVLADDAAAGWCRTENWDASEISARGRFEGGLAGRRIVMLGAGALGAAVATLLVRGGASDLAILDGGELEVGNLTRHELGMNELGRNKAVALAGRLNQLSPTARVVGYPANFPLDEGPDREFVEGADLYIDASTSDRVIEALASKSWPIDRSFVSISFSFGAEHLYLYIATGRTFPKADFLAAIGPWLDVDARKPEDFPQ